MLTFRVIETKDAHESGISSRLISSDGRWMMEIRQLVSRFVIISSNSRLSHFFKVEDFYVVVAYFGH